MFATKYSPTQTPHGWTLRHDGFPRCPFSAKSFESLSAFGGFCFVRKTCFFKKITRPSLGFAVLVSCNCLEFFSVYPCWTLKCKQGGQEKKMELRIADDSIPWKFRKSIENMQSSYLDDTPPCLLKNGCFINQPLRNSGWTSRGFS